MLVISKNFYLKILNTSENSLFSTDNFLSELFVEIFLKIPFYTFFMGINVDA